MNNTTGKRLKGLHHEDDLSFNKLVSVARGQRVNNLGVEVVMAMSFEYTTLHFYGEEYDKDSQQSEALLNTSKKPPAVIPKKRRRKQG